MDFKLVGSSKLADFKPVEQVVEEESNRSFELQVVSEFYKL
ncbi:13818_t:CDS:2 [Dentiscutata erythropus]|uniref:13818_t:CDS:1 n=1 Tax=Dentiscutata erythropus TaxID=1348616 RepID=A0A9N9G8Q6_9GLOM|nr:13818_t:CDS:2 [Dentiscutata erythropus]